MCDGSPAEIEDLLWLAGQTVYDWLDTVTERNFTALGGFSGGTILLSHRHQVDRTDGNAGGVAVGNRLRLPDQDTSNCA